MFNSSPKSFLAPFYLGEVFLDKKDYKQAKKLLTKANTRSKGTYRHILYKLGQLHLEEKDYQSAIEVFEEIMKLDENYKDAQTHLTMAKKKAKK